MGLHEDEKLADSRLSKLNEKQAQHLQAGLDRARKERAGKQQQASAALGTDQSTCVAQEANAATNDQQEGAGEYCPAVH